MSESNSVRVSLVQRTSFATPAALNMLVLATTGQSLRPNVGYAESQTLRTDANIQDLIRLSLSASGGLPLEMQFPVVNEALWFVLRAALRAVEDAERSESGCTSTIGTTNITIGSGTWTSGPPVDVQVGDIVKVTGSSADGFRKVLALSGGNTIITLDGANFTSTDVTTTVVRGARMKNGTQRYFFDVEVGRLDVNLFAFYEKFAIDGLAINVSDNAITSAALSLVGVTSQRGGSSFCLGHANPTAGPILDALGVPVFHLGGLPYSAKSIGFAISNNVRTRTQVGTLGGTALPFGAFRVTTRSTSYLSNWTEMNNYTGNVPSDMWFVMQNTNNQAISFSFPRHKWSDLSDNTQGLNQDDYLEGVGLAYLHPTELCTMRAQRWVA